MDIKTIRFSNDRLFIIDQTCLPNKLVEIELNTLEKSIEAIKRLRVRGAPAIGITAAYALFLQIKQLTEQNQLGETEVYSAAEQLKQARPTAVNLQWAVDRMLKIYRLRESVPSMLNKLREEALNIHEADRETCKKIGEHGAPLVHDGYNILTHCNAGILATGGIGTALSVIYTAHDQGKKLHVYVDETRPLGQGARLTYWELNNYGVPATLITDNMSGSLMNLSKINMIIVGADRIACNGDFANKIGTYTLAVLAQYHNIPFYCAAPKSTFDPDMEHGNDIAIELRTHTEVTGIWNIDGGNDYKVYNPAFDITPEHLVSGIITEKGIIRKPFTENISHFLFN